MISSAIWTSRVLAVFGAISTEPLKLFGFNDPGMGGSEWTGPVDGGVPPFNGSS